MYEWSQILGKHWNEILKYCLGENWEGTSIDDSVEKFNKLLDIHIQYDMTHAEGFKMVKEKYEWLFCYDRIKREVLIEKTHKLFR